MSFFGNNDYYLEVSRGNVPGVTAGFIVGVIPSLGELNTETVWDVGGTYDYLTTDTQLYISSSSASDTSVSVLVTGLDDTFTEITRTVTVGGQSQVALSGLMFRVHSAFVTGPASPGGDLYISESTTLSGGVPTTNAPIQAKIPLSGISGDPA